MIEPLIKTVEVPCNQETAFKVFIDEMHSWWPLGKFTVSAMAGSPAKTIRIEPKVGGDIVEIGPNDEEYIWGTIKSYDPNDFLAMTFHIPTPDEFKALSLEEKTAQRSLIEVRFTVLDETRTHVELKQSNWEAFGDQSRIDALRGGYNGGLEFILCQAYKAAFQASR